MCIDLIFASLYRKVTAWCCIYPGYIAVRSALYTCLHYFLKRNAPSRSHLMPITYNVYGLSTMHCTTARNTLLVNAIIDKLYVM